MALHIVIFRTDMHIQGNRIRIKRENYAFTAVLEAPFTYVLNYVHIRTSPSPQQVNGGYICDFRHFIRDKKRESLVQR